MNFLKTFFTPSKSSSSKSTTAEDQVALEEIEKFGKDLINIRLSALLSVYKQYLNNEDVKNSDRYEISRVATQKHVSNSKNSNLEMDYLRAVKIGKTLRDEYGIYNVEEVDSSFSNFDMEDLDEDSQEWYEVKLRREKLKKEQELIAQRLLEEKQSRGKPIYCKGEEEFLKSTKSKEIRRYIVHRNPTFEFEAEYIHFRIVESQFDRLMNRVNYGYGMQAYHIDKVEYISHPDIFRKFYACKKELAKKHNFLYDSMNCYLLFHGTSDANMENIIKTNFLLSKVGSSTDKGFYGGGFYFSENPQMSISYSRGNPYLLICMVMVGKALQMTTVQLGRDLEPGYDSHVSPDGCSEVIIFNPDQVIPMYKVHYLAGPPTFNDQQPTITIQKL